jgi:hypothetical protein
LLCYFAGKELEYDPFLAGQLIATQRVPEQSVLSKLEQRYFQTVQLAEQLKASYAAEPLWRRERFSEAWLVKLSQRYEVARVSDQATFFVARHATLP